MQHNLNRPFRETLEELGLILGFIALGALLCLGPLYAGAPDTHDVEVPHLKIDNTVGTLVVEAGPQDVPVVCIEDRVAEDTGMLTCLIVENGARRIIQMPFAISQESK
ncbi:MAG: hypothetical protein M0P95_17865 [Sulfuritalea sp.]|jgi:hypothetical protein|nr:hypothetical protein [Sulfuritalea sp.]